MGVVLCVIGSAVIAGLTLIAVRLVTACRELDFSEDEMDFDNS